MVRSVLVAGYGTMGRGVAAFLAEAGFEVTVLTRDPSRIEGLAATSDPPDAAPDLVMENYPEDMAAKAELFARLEAAYGGGPVIATNTSGLPLDEMAAGLAFPDRFLAIHFLQPADAFPLVEIVRAGCTSDAALEAAVDAMRRAGRESVVLNRPVVGFLFNRLQHALLHEAYWLMEEGVVGAEDIDRYARLAFGPRMSVTGLLEQKDLGGLDVHAAAQRSIVPHLHHGAEPIGFVQEMAARGDLGAKSGRGFYDWTRRDAGARRARAADRMRRILEIAAED